MNEHDEDQADGPGQLVQRHTYRIEVQVPRVARPDTTTWRTVVPPAPFNVASDAGTHLRESLLLWGFSEAEVNAWFATHVRCVEYTVQTRRVRDLPMASGS